ncbi:hypothetical protein [Cohnella panacarvi]|uniref:hypothetical protein n=1 Tax=Cohnella panacarvi TaxID=400776 RepID=UPI00047AE517|nr:hypothetical protein [Cohnella panacarvi]
MSSLFLIVVAIGIIYQLFVRKSPLDKRPNRMPDFGGPQQRRPGSPPQRGVPMRIPPARQEQPRPIPQPIFEEESVEPRAIVPEPRTIPLASQAGSALPERTYAKSPHPSESLSRDELARAVMWAEILGPPRARKPHRR